MASERPLGWRTPSRSQGAHNCVEIGHVADRAAVRDTKNRDAGYLTTTGKQWAAFISSIKAGRYDA